MAFSEKWKEKWGWGEGNGCYIRTIEYGCPCCTLHNCRDHSFRYGSVLYKFTKNSKHREILLGASLDRKEPACNAGDLGSIPGLRESLEEENGNPLQYFCLKNLMDREVWLQSKGLQRVGHNWVARHKWQLVVFTFFSGFSCTFLKCPKWMSTTFIVKSC